MIKKQSRIFIILLTMLPFTLLFGQLVKHINNPISVENMIQIRQYDRIKPMFSLFDSNKFSMSQSYSLSAGSSGNSAFSTGMYLNNMTYMVSDKLLMNARVGFVHDPLKLGNTPTIGYSMENLIYGADITYRPFDNFLLRFSFNKTPMSTYGYNPYYSGINRYSMFDNFNTSLTRYTY